MKPIGEHLRRLTLHVTRYYPDHEKRVESAEYQRTRCLLIDVEKRGCWICGTRLRLECHHFYIEWADMYAVDWRRFQALHPHLVDWSSFGETPWRFVDHPANMKILCRKHHRHVNHGIHCLPFPDWQLQHWKRGDFVFAPQAQLTGAAHAHL